MAGQVYAVLAVKFWVNTGARLPLDPLTGFGAVPGADWVTVADCETFNMSFDNNIEEWTPIGSNGWTRRLMTGKSLTIGVDGKRSVGDPGNDYIAQQNYQAYSFGAEPGSIQMVVEFPDGAQLHMEAVANVTENGGGDSTAVGALNWEAMSNGTPVFIDA